VRGLLVALAGGLGLGAFWRRHRRKPAAEGWSSELGPDPAEELRTKLAESKETTEAEPAVQATGDPDASPLDPEVRRRGVHDHARASMDELG
jgi:hypothetical protein